MGGAAIAQPAARRQLLAVRRHRHARAAAAQPLCGGLRVRMECRLGRHACVLQTASPGLSSQQCGSVWLPAILQKYTVFTSNTAETHSAISLSATTQRPLIASVAPARWRWRRARWRRVFLHQCWRRMKQGGRPPSPLSSLQHTRRSSPPHLSHPCRYLDLLRRDGGVSRQVWEEMRQLAGAGSGRVWVGGWVQRWAHKAGWARTRHTRSRRPPISPIITCVPLPLPTPAELRFHYRDKQSGYGYASSLAQAMQARLVGLVRRGGGGARLQPVHAVVTRRPAAGRQRALGSAAPLPDRRAAPHLHLPSHPRALLADLRARRPAAGVVQRAAGV